MKLRPPNGAEQTASEQGLYSDQPLMTSANKMATASEELPGPSPPPKLELLELHECGHHPQQDDPS